MMKLQSNQNKIWKIEAKENLHKKGLGLEIYFKLCFGHQIVHQKILET